MLVFNKLNRYIVKRINYAAPLVKKLKDSHILNTLLIGINEITDRCAKKVIIRLFDHNHTYEIYRDNFIDTNYYNIIIIWCFRNMKWDFIRIIDTYHDNKFERQSIEIENRKARVLIPNIKWPFNQIVI